MPITYDFQKKRFEAQDWRDLNVSFINQLFLKRVYGNPLQDNAADFYSYRFAKNPIVQVDMASFMNDGPGRYVRLSDFPITEELFLLKTLPSGNALQNIPNGTYTREQLVGEHGIFDAYFKVTLVQTLVDPASQDYIDRAYVYGKSGYVLSKDSRFKIDDNSVSIEHAEIRVFDDNFDFDSDDPATEISNTISESIVDPNGVGETIEIQYRGGGRAVTNYSNSDYHSDLNDASEERITLVEAAVEYADKIVPALRKRLSDQCFAAGTMIQMADGTEKPIEQIRVGDQVMSFDDPNGELVTSTVTQTFETPDQLVIDFHGTYVTPGHVYVCPDGQYRMLIDILEQDGAIVIADGRHIRARTGYEVGSDEDAVVMAGIVQDDGDIKAVPVRAGMIVGADGDGRPLSILEFMDDIGWRLERDVKGFKMRDWVSPEVMGFPWHYAGVPFDPRMVAEQFAEYRQGRIRVAKGRPVFAEDREFRGSIPERFVTAH